jgi:hypothetical protein
MLTHKDFPASSGEELPALVAELQHRIAELRQPRGLVRYVQSIPQAACGQQAEAQKRAMSRGRASQY